MLPSILPVTLLALQGASFVLGGPIQARAGWPTPSEKQMRERLEAVDDEAYEYVFYIGRDPMNVARPWARDRTSTPTLTVWDTDKDLNNRGLWEHPDDAQKLWCAEYTKQARGTAWLFWKDSGKVPTEGSSWYYDIELPILEDRVKGPGHDLEELIQVNMQNTKDIHQIMPVDVSDYKGKQCAWHGTAPECNAKCPDGTKKITESKYGDDIDGKCEEDGRKVFCCKKD